MSSWPAADRRRAMGAPMLPTPMSPILGLSVMVRSASPSSWRRDLGVGVQPVDDSVEPVILGRVERADQGVVARDDGDAKGSLSRAARRIEAEYDWDRVVDGTSGTFGVRLELPNADHAVPSGLRCQVRFLRVD